MAPPRTVVTTSSCSLLLIYRPRKDERFSWPSWLTYSGRFTHISGHRSAVGGAQDSGSSPVKDQRSIPLSHGTNHNWSIILMGWQNRAFRCIYCVICFWRDCFVSNQIKCLPVFLYELEVCPLTKSDLQSLDFVVNHFLMKFFNISNLIEIDICGEYLVFELKSELLHGRSQISVGAMVQLVEYRTRNREVAGSTRTRSTASNLEQVANPAH